MKGEKIEDYRERGYEPDEFGCFEEWSLWLKENAVTLPLSELEATIRQMQINESPMAPIYEEHIEICLRAKSIRTGSV